MIPRGVLLSASPVIGGGGGITVGLVIGLQLVIVAIVLGGFAWYVRGRRPGWSSGARLGAILSGLAGTVLLLAAILDPGGTAGTPLVNPVSHFFFNDAATTEIYPLSLHDALPIWFVRVPSCSSTVEARTATEPGPNRSTVARSRSAT